MAALGCKTDAYSCLRKSGRLRTPGSPSPKQAGKTVLKRRQFILDQPLYEAQAQYLRAQVSEMMGIEAIEVCASEVTVTYDLLQATALQVEATLESTGAKLGSGWAERLRRGFVHYTEECEIGNLQAGPSGCH